MSSTKSFYFGSATQKTKSIVFEWGRENCAVEIVEKLIASQWLIGVRLISTSSTQSTFFLTANIRHDMFVTNWLILLFHTQNLLLHLFERIIFFAINGDTSRSTPPDLWSTDALLLRSHLTIDYRRCTVNSYRGNGKHCWYGVAPVHRSNGVHIERLRLDL